MKKLLGLLTVLVTLCSNNIFGQSHAFEMNAKLGNGINLGNAFEAPSLGEWGVTVTPKFFSDIKAQGFTHVRIPARWSAYAPDIAPYTIAEYFLDTVQWAVDEALKNGLSVVLDVHHFEEMFVDPEANKDKLLGMWGQISARFEGYTDSLYLEIMNEPHDNYSTDIWNAHLLEALAVIRVKHPTRMVVIGTAEYGGIGGLSKLEIPATDTNLIVTVHYYNPFSFTHQGATWAGQSATEVSWDSTATEIAAVKNDFDQAQAYSVAHNVPIYVGEFGAIQDADDLSRARWAGHLRVLFEQYGYSSAYWEYASGFGIYDAGLDCFYSGLVQALTDSIPDCNCAQFDTMLVKNSEFKTAITPWSTYSQLGATAKMELVNEEARLEIISPGTSFWHIQTMYRDIELKYGSTYRLEFEAYASAETSIGAQVSYNGGDYSVVSSTDVALTTTKTYFAQTFTMDKPTYDNMRLVFECGEATAQYIYFDNVHLYEVIEGVPVSDITIQAVGSQAAVITDYQGSIQLEALVLPVNASSSDVVWSVKGGNVYAQISETGLLTSTGAGNVSVTVVATAYDGNGVSATLSVPISNQATSIIENEGNVTVLISGIPYNFKGTEIKQVNIYDVLGQKEKSLQNISSGTDLLDFIQLAEGLKVIQVTTNAGVYTVKNIQ